MRTPSYISLLSGVALLFLVAACDTTGANETDLSASDDVAQSLVSLVGEDTGGLLEQAADVFELASAGDIAAQETMTAGKADASVSSSERTYDEATGSWTITLTREIGNPEGPRYLSVHRQYLVQFQNAAGLPQKFFVTQGDTARSIDFTIVEAGGTLISPHLTAERTNISGHWLATGVHTDEVTLNGTYSRSGGHTITTDEAVRTLDYTLALDVFDLVGPKGSRRDLSQKVSGTLTGTYEAVATFERGDAYHEREIQRNVVVVFDHGTATITVNGVQYEGDLQSGDPRFLGPPDRR